MLLIGILSVVVLFVFVCFCKIAKIEDEEFEEMVKNK